MGLTLADAVSSEMLRDSRNRFYRFHDESFAPLGIHPGDIALAQRRPLTSGKIAAVETHDAGDLVRIVDFYDDMVRLKALHPRFKDLWYQPSQIKVMGAVIDVFDGRTASRIRNTFPNLFSEQLEPVVAEFSTDSDGNVIECSKLWTRLTGCEFNNLSGWKWLRLVHPEQRDRVRTEWSQALDKGTAYNTRYWCQTVLGKYRLAVVQVAPTLSVTGDFLLWEGSARIE